MERAVQNPSIEDVTVEDPLGTLIKLQARKAPLSLSEIGAVVPD